MIVSSNEMAEIAAGVMRAATASVSEPALRAPLARLLRAALVILGEEPPAATLSAPVLRAIEALAGTLGQAAEQAEFLVEHVISPPRP